MHNLKKYIWIGSMAITTGAIILSSAFVNTKESRYTPVNYKNSIEKKGIAGAIEYIHSLRANPETDKIDPRDVINARIQADELLRRQGKNRGGSLGINWIEAGPDNVGGRTRALLIDKDDYNIMYAGGVGGGLWKSTTGGTAWKAINDTFKNLSVVSICQTSNGDIYFGTGEGYLTSAGGDKSSGDIGGGVWKSTDNGTTWSHLSSTTPLAGFPSNNTSDTWAAVSALASHPTEANTVYAATLGGLKVTTDGGTTWIVASGTQATASSKVEVGSDATVIAIIGGRFYRKLASSNTFEDRSGLGGFPLGIGRTHLAIAPSDPNYMYASVTSGGVLMNIYQSTDNGENWTVIGAGGAPEIFDPFSRGGSGGQGWYDNVIGVSPANPEKVFLGGISFWGWEKSKGWKQVGSLFDSPTNEFYVHADCHSLAFHPTNHNIMYVGNDGGVFMSKNTLSDQPTFVPRNNGYNVTQFYSVAATIDGSGILGGTQDNGTRFIDGTGNTVMSSDEVAGGDGGDSEVSAINPKALFGGSPAGSNGALGTHFRSPNAGNSFSSYYDNNIDSDGDKSPAGGAPFVMAFHLWESFNDKMSTDSLQYVVCDTCSFSAGDTISVNSNNNLFPINYVTPVSLSANDTILIQDIVQAKMYIGAGSTVWMTRECLDFGTIPEWFKVSSVSGTVLSMSSSKDGDVLFVASRSGLYRISGLSTAKYQYNGTTFSPSAAGITTKTMRNFNLPVTGVDVHDDDPNIVVMTLGAYSNGDHVYYSTNALDASPTFTSIHGNLPYMPVYDAVVFEDPNYEKGSGYNWIVLATDLGIYATNFVPASGAPIWFEENDGHPRVATHQIKRYPYSPYPWQDWGGLRLFTGTHGRGFFKSKSFLTGIDDKEPNKATPRVNTITIFPNPVINQNVAINYEVVNSGDINLEIYNISGKLIYSNNLGKLNNGVYQHEINTSNLNAGTYFVRINSSQDLYSTNKFIVIK